MGFCVSQLLESRADFCLRENSETEVLIEGAVPRDVYESGEGQRLEALRDGPRLSLLDQSASNPLTLVTGINTYLLDVAYVVNEIDQDVTERMIGIIDGDPRSGVIGVTGEYAD